MQVRPVNLLLHQLTATRPRDRGWRAAPVETGDGCARRLEHSDHGPLDTRPTRSRNPAAEPAIGRGHPRRADRAGNVPHPYGSQGPTLATCRARPGAKRRITVATEASSARPPATAAAALEPRMISVELAVTAVGAVMTAVEHVVIRRWRWRVLVLELDEPDPDQIPQHRDLVMYDLPWPEVQWGPPSCSGSGFGMAIIFSSGTRSGWAHQAATKSSRSSSGSAIALGFTISTRALDDPRMICTRRRREEPAPAKPAQRERRGHRPRHAEHQLEVLLSGEANDEIVRGGATDRHHVAADAEVLSQARHDHRGRDRWPGA